MHGKPGQRYLIGQDNNQRMDDNPKGSIVAQIFSLEESLSLNQKLDI